MDSADASRTARSHAVSRFLPVLGWLPDYDRSWLTRDSIAGLTVWALVVPESMAYAAIAGVPVQYGLYAVPLALLGYVVFGSCRQLFVGPSATVASISAVTVASAATASTTGDQFIALTAVLALMVGVIYVVLGVARMGFVARFFAKPVLDGFIVGLGLFIAVGQFPKLVGIPKPSGDTVRIFFETLRAIGSWQGATVVVGVCSLAALFLMARFLPKAPGALIVVALSIVAVRVLDLTGHGVAIVGAVPTGFHFVSWSGIGWTQLRDLLPGAFAVVVVGFAQSVAIAKAYGAKLGYRVDANQELIGYGAANIGAGALQGFTVTGSLSKSGAAEEAGGKSPVLLLVTGGFVVLTILVLAGLFHNLAEATLAAVVIHAVSGMIDFPKLARIWRTHRAEFMLALGTLLGVVVIDILPGVVIGVVLSFGLLIHRLDHPHTALLGRSRDGKRFEDLAAHGDAQPIAETLVYRFEAPLIFANAEVFGDGLLHEIEAADPAPLTVILDLEAVPDIDSTGEAALVDLKHRLDTRGTRLLLVRALGDVRAQLSPQTAAALGVTSFFETVRDAVAFDEGNGRRAELAGEGIALVTP